VTCAAIIEARMASTRLPGKVLRPIMGRPMLELLIERLQRAETLDCILVATTEKGADDPICALAERLGIGYYRGSEEDVLDRVLRTARAFSVADIIEITGDCPLIDPAVVDRVVREYRGYSCEYASNVIRRTYPRGMDTQVFSTAVLERVARLTDDPAYREHVSLYIYEHPEIFRLCSIESGLPEWVTRLRLTVDTGEDFTLVSAIFEALSPQNPAFGLSDIVRLLEERPDLQEINRHVGHKEVYR